MYVVIFRAEINQLDDEYGALAAKLRQRAFDEYGCLDFTSTIEAGQEIALSYWPSREAVAAWSADDEHRQAQVMGRRKWYKSVKVEVAKLV